MKRRFRALALVSATILALTVFAVWVEFVLSRGRTPPIDAPDAIASLEQVRLGDVEQWILIRGRDRSNPVLLFLHGGPGMPAMFLAHAFQHGLEQDFVVVQWDRRGAGKSFDAAAKSPVLSVSQTLADTLELSRILRTRFHQPRIYLVGHSWGTYLGLLAVRAHPEYYAAYVGTGQLAGNRAEVQRARLDFLTRAAERTNDAELRARLATGTPSVTENDLFEYGGELYGAHSFWPILKTGLMAPEYTLRDVLNVKKGADLVAREMRYDLEPKPLEGEIQKVDVPVFLFLGRHDFNTPSQLAAAYLGRLDAPLKGLVWFEHSAHFPFFSQPGRFHREMVDVEHEVSAYWKQQARQEDEAEGRQQVPK